MLSQNAVVFAANNSKTQIEQKRAQAKKEIHKLKLLEKIETNKLYRNQRKLEQTEQGLYYNKQQYKNAQEELYSLQVQLENALKKFKILVLENYLKRNKHTTGEILKWVYM